MHGFLKWDIPSWLYYATIRVIVVLPTPYCFENGRAEGRYQLLIFTQVLVALQHPIAMIPLFRVAMSRSIMGVHKISPYLGLLAFIIFIGMLGLNIIFVVEMIVSNHNRAGGLRWDVGIGVFVSYFTTASASLFLMILLVATPLRSANTQLDTQVYIEDCAESTS
ncbi:hypothetical protein VNO77_15370 [Canavalia gladiata]|uniref:Uncharacterized protein n=1 Tax=Canavalia gladiata TaxID=3824 RepID=A0AAN9QVU1_CANGL